MTFFDAWRLIVLVKLTDALTPSGTALNPLTLAAADSAAKSLPALANSSLRLGELHPADRLALVHMIALGVELELRPGPARLDHAPAIGGGLGIVDDDHRGGALPRGFLELVGPAAVIGHRLAFEEAVACPASASRDR